MHPTPESSPKTGSSSEAAANFAGLLASLIASTPKQAAEPDTDGLADDVATLSYESALRAHARYKPISDPILMPESPAPAVVEQKSQEEAIAAASPLPQPAAAAQPRPVPAPVAESAWTEPEDNRKSASVTLRMSAAECQQLRRRAAEAGMTVSAYLRSCTFEAETLRAQVKETLATLRAASTVKAVQPKSARLGALHRLLPRLHPAA